MKNLPEKLTVFLLTGQNNINLPNVKKALDAQTVPFTFEIIDGYRPLGNALQEMINRCKTPYYIQLDEDMVLKPDAIETMYKAMVKQKEFCCLVFPLNDISLNQKIYGIKIFNHEIMSKYSYDTTSESPSADFFQKIANDGFKYHNEQTIVGDHSPLWTPETIYDRYFILTKKIKTDTNSGGYGDLEEKFSSRLKERFNELDYWAYLGVIFAKYSRKKISYNSVKELFKEEPSKLRIGKIIDQFGWAFYFVAKEMKKYSRFNISYEKYNNVHYDKLDIVLISNPNIASEISSKKIPHIAKESGLKVIGQYCGEVNTLYEDVDMIITISPQTYNFAKSKYTVPVIYLPESIDTNLFIPKEFNPDSFIVGWAGRENEIKRPYLLSKLAYPVKKKADWGTKFFKDGVTSQPMVDFYNEIDCFVLTSASECQPRVVMEAMACGLPVISTDVGSISMLLEKDWVVPVMPDELVIKKMNEKLKRLAEDPELRRNVGIRNRNFIHKNYSWYNNQKYWDEVFESLYNNDIENIYRIHNIFIKRFGRHFSTKKRYTFNRNTNKLIQDNPVNQSTPSRASEDLLNVLAKIKKLNIKCWCLKRTCLYMVNEIKKPLDIITVGVKSEADKEKILSQVSDTIEVIVNPKQETKPWKDITNVPMPVVPYLQNMFGNSWAELTS